MALSYYADCKNYGPGDSDEAVKALVNETLDYNPDVKCSYHEHNHILIH